MKNKSQTIYKRFLPVYKRLTISSIPSYHPENISCRRILKADKEVVVLSYFFWKLSANKFEGRKVENGEWIVGLPEEF